MAIRRLSKFLAACSIFYFIFLFMLVETSQADLAPACKYFTPNPGNTTEVATCCKCSSHNGALGQCPVGFPCNTGSSAPTGYGTCVLNSNNQCICDTSLPLTGTPLAPGCGGDCSGATSGDPCTCDDGKAGTCQWTSQSKGCTPRLFKCYKKPWWESTEPSNKF